MGEVDKRHSDAGGVALKAWRDNSDVQKRGCCATPPASEVSASLLHGFALRASPAVKHGVSPLGTVGENAVSRGRVNAISGRADRIRVRVDRLILFSNTISA